MREVEVQLTSCGSRLGSRGGCFPRLRSCNQGYNLRASVHSSLIGFIAPDYSSDPPPQRLSSRRPRFGKRAYNGSLNS